MNKKKYLIPTVRTIDLVEEGMIAASGEKTVGIGDGSIGTDGMRSNEKDMWGNEDIWK